MSKVLWKNMKTEGIEEKYTPRRHRGTEGREHGDFAYFPCRSDRKNTQNVLIEREKEAIAGNKKNYKGILT